jgi:hypothetical protein
MRQMYVLLMAAVLAPIGVARAEVSSADVKIQSIVAFEDVDLATGARFFVCRVTVHNDNDDDARDVRLIVLMPLEVQVIASPSICNLAVFPPVNPYVHCNLRSMIVTETRKIGIRSTVPQTTNHCCSAFVYNQVSDINPTNNFGFACAKK